MLPLPLKSPAGFLLSSEDLLPQLLELFDYSIPSVVTDRVACPWLCVQLYCVAEQLGVLVSFHIALLGD